MDALDGPRNRAAILSRARAIRASSPRPPPPEIYRQLLAAAAGGRIPKRQLHDKVIKGSSGEALFRIRHRRGGVAILLPGNRVSDPILSKIQLTLVEMLQNLSHR